MGLKGRRRFDTTMVSLQWFWQALTRRKMMSPAASPSSPSPGDDAGTSPPPAASSSSTQLARVLSTFDLTALGVGSTLGVGVYVLAGSVARDYAGPAVILSFFVAAVASVFAGLCYAEFGARVPLAGSAYIYSYVSIGEFMAFVIGWNLIMEYVIGCASVARGLSNYLDQLSGNVMRESFQQVWYLHVDFLSPYIDFFAFSISLLLSVVLAVGVKESMNLNNIFTMINMSVVIFVIVAGSFKADISNWEIDVDKVQLPPGARGGQGGFFPFGIMGVLRGAATCFYGFIGFDCIATTGEEVKNPQRAIPVAIIVSLIIIFLSYFGVSAVLTLMWPYYLQDADAPLPYVFHQIGWTAAQWIVAIGGIFGLFASLFGAMYPLPRIIYAMANDGLIFRFLGEVHPKYKTPLVGTLLAGLITGVMGALFKLQQLVNMLSIGTLVAYTIVAACVLLLRYTEVQESGDLGVTEYKETTNLVSLKDKPTVSKLLAQSFNWQGFKSPTAISSRLVSIEVLLYCALSIALGLCLVHMENELVYGHWDALTLVCTIGSLMLLVVLSMALQPSSTRLLPFKVPFVPVIPALSITLNIYLILMLDINTWIRFSIWMAVGVGVYFITLLCRTKNLCGCTLTSHARPVEATTALGTATIASCNGAIRTNLTSFINNNSTENHVIVEEKLTNIAETSLPNKIAILQESSDPKSESMFHEPTGNASSGVSVFVVNESLKDNFNGKDYEEENSIGANSHDSDDASITEVTNELLSLTHQNEHQLKNFDHASEREALKSHDNAKDKQSITVISIKEIKTSNENSISLDGCILQGTDTSAMNANELSSIGFCETCSHQTNFGSNVDENETEEDVRSLYPDVVVISSSDEEILSKSSSLTSRSTLISDSNTFAIDETESATSDSGSTFKSSQECAPTAYVKAARHQDFTRKSPMLDKTDMTHINCGSLKNLSDGKYDASPVIDSEVTSPLKNSNFVEKLEKIIGAQSLKMLPSTNPVLKKIKSMGEIVHTVEGEEARLTCQVDVADNLLVKRRHSEERVNEEMPVEEHCEGSDRSVVKVEDIRAKLEKIFSLGLITYTSTPTCMIDSELANSESIGNKVDSENNGPANILEEESEDYSNNNSTDERSGEILETRRKMANVLGTLVKSVPNPSSS